MSKFFFQFQMSFIWCTILQMVMKNKSLLHKYFNTMSVCPHGVIRPSTSWPTSNSCGHIKKCDMKVACVKSEKYAFLVILPLGLWGEGKPSYVHYIFGQGEFKLGILKLTLLFHHLPNISPKQMFALAHLGRTRKAGTS